MFTMEVNCEGSEGKLKNTFTGTALGEPRMGIGSIVYTWLLILHSFTVMMIVWDES